jgi:hypothetical protein
MLSLISPGCNSPPLTVRWLDTVDPEIRLAGGADDALYKGIALDYGAASGRTPPDNQEIQMAEQVAEVPPHTKKKTDVVNSFKTNSGFEGYETELGQSINVVLKMLSNHAGYAHEMNDPLVKAHLMAIQFAKDNGLLKEYVEQDIKTMLPINTRMRQIIEKTGEKEIALVGLFDRTACHYALALDTDGKGNSRSWTSPFKTVLDACHRIGQFDLTEEEIHQNWTKPRLTGYARDMGVEIEVSDMDENRRITASIVD